MASHPTCQARDANVVLPSARALYCGTVTSWHCDIVALAADTPAAHARVTLTLMTLTLVAPMHRMCWVTQVADGDGSWRELVALEVAALEPKRWMGAACVRVGAACVRVYVRGA